MGLSGEQHSQRLVSRQSRAPDPSVIAVAILDAPCGITGRSKVARGAAPEAARPDGTAHARSRGNRHQERDRGARSFLTSKPHPKASP